MTAGNSDAAGVSPDYGTGSAPFLPGLFEDTADGVRLCAGRCTACAALSFPRREICAACGDEDVAAVSLPATGRVYASTVVRVPSPLGIAAPYGSGYVDLDVGPLRVFAWFGPAADGAIPPGTRVAARSATLRTDAQGQARTAYCFLPVEPGA